MLDACDLERGRIGVVFGDQRDRRRGTALSVERAATVVTLWNLHGVLRWKKGRAEARPLIVAQLPTERN